MGRIDHATKLEIASLHKQGFKSKRIRSTLEEQGLTVTKNVVDYWIRQSLSGNIDTPRERVTIFKSVTERDIQVARETLSKDPNQSSRDIHKVLKADGADFSLGTTKNVIKAAGFTNSSPRYAQMVRDVNKTKRFEFCTKLIEANDSFDDVIFSDESSIQLHNNKTTSYRPVDSLNPAMPKPKHPLKLHVWAAISRRGATRITIFKDIMQKEFFTNSILKDNLLPFVIRKFPDHHRFQQDNDPKHRSKMSTEFMAENGINWFPWPPGTYVLYIFHNK